MPNAPTSVFAKDRFRPFAAGARAPRTTAALLAIALLCGFPLPSAVAQSTMPAIPSSPADALSQEDLEAMLGPIALYPDVLLANVLAASVFPADVAAAQAMRQRGGDPVANGDAAWDPSVRMVAEFPDVLAMMAEYDDWTTALGEAYLLQPGDVMDALQSLRAIAWNNGALQTTPQQVVVKEGPTIIIEPADPQIIFVPRYSPTVVFVRNPVTPVTAAVIGFGVGVAVGAVWSNNVHCSWGGRCVAWGPSWWGRHSNVNVNVNNNININTGNRTGIVNRPGGRPGSAGSPWRPDSSRIPSGRPDRPAGRPALNDFRGVGGGTASGGSGAAGRIPGRPSGGGSSIGGPSGGAVARPPLLNPGGRPTNLPAAGGNRPGGGAGSAGGSAGGATRLPSGVSRPTTPVARPADRPPPSFAPPSGSRPSGFPSGGNRAGASRPSGAPSRASGFQPGSGGAGRLQSAGGARPSGGQFGGGGGGGARPGGARLR